MNRNRPRQEFLDCYSVSPEAQLSATGILRDVDDETYGLDNGTSPFSRVTRLK